MYLVCVKLWNFRKYGSERTILDPKQPDLKIRLQPGLNVLIGENDSGKSAIIDAIKIALKTHSYEYIRIEETDFYDKSTFFRIELYFDGFESHEAKNFLEWLSWYGEGDNVKPYLRVVFDCKRQADRILPAELKGGVDVEGTLMTAEAREYLKVTYLKPLRDAENELVAKRNSRLSQVLLGDPAFKNNGQEHELLAIFNETNRLLEGYFTREGTTQVGEKTIQTNNLAEPHPANSIHEGKLIKDKIDKFIKSFFGSEGQSYISALSNSIRSILEKLSISLKDEVNPGLGTLNRLFMAVELLHLDRLNWSGLRLGLIEELEAHLHPQAQMQVIESLQKQKDIQLILTTHSPNLASKVKLDNIIICNDKNVFPLRKGATELIPDDYIFLEKFLDVTKSNLFFAKGIILVEGWAEEILIPSIAKNIGIDLTLKGVSIINVGGVAFDRYYKILLRKESPDMTIPIAVITDLDVCPYIKSKDTGEITKKNGEVVLNETTSKIKALEDKSVKNIRYFVAPIWTLEYCLLLSKSLQDTFLVAAKDIHSGTDWETDPEKELAKKLLNGGLNKTEIAYKMAEAIDKDIEAGTKENKKIIITPNDQEDKIQYIIEAIKYVTNN